MNREEYERDLAQRQQDHLKKIAENQNNEWKPCAHDQCQECVGTGIRRDGKACVHYLHCDCPKHAPRIASLTEDRSSLYTFTLNNVPTFYAGLRMHANGSDVTGELGYTGQQGLPYIQLD